MASFKVFALCILACVLLNTANATCGYGPDLRGLGLAGLAIPYPALREPTPAAYGGTGRGNVGIAGVLPVRGETALTGQVPIIGAVEYAGCVPAAGVVTIQGSCGCGCGRF